MRKKRTKKKFRGTHISRENDGEKKRAKTMWKEKNLFVNPLPWAR